MLVRSTSRLTMEHMLQDVTNVDLLPFKTWFLFMRKTQKKNRLYGLFKKLEIWLHSNLTKDNIYLVVSDVGEMELLKNKQSVFK